MSFAVLGSPVPVRVPASAEGFGAARRSALRARRRRVRAAVSAALLLAATSGFVRDGAASPMQANAANATADANAGRAMYAKAGCEKCHGVDGRGTAAAPRIAAATLPLAGFIAYTRKPTGTMPPHTADIVPDRALSDIYAFLRSVDAQPQASPAAAPAGRVDAGAALYKKIGCQQCHVNEGQGGAAGPRIGPDPIPFARFVQYVRNPTGDMPPYTSKVVSDQDIADIYAFLQVRRRPPAVNTIPLLAQ